MGVRKNKKSVSFWLNDEEYTMLKNKVTEAGCTQQDFITAAIKESMVTSYEELDELRLINWKISEYEERLQKIKKRIKNQLEQDRIQSIGDIREDIEDLYEIGKEANQTWGLINELIERR